MTRKSKTEMFGGNLDLPVPHPLAAVRDRESVKADLPAAGSGDSPLRESLLSPEEILHISRLVTIGELSACFAHDVFNPLMMIRGTLRFAEEIVAKDDPVRSHLEVIDRNSRRIEDMAKRILDFSRKRMTELEACEIQPLIDEAVRFVQPYLRFQTVDLRTDTKVDNLVIQADRWGLVQALVNLMQNAAEAMADSTPRVLELSCHAEAGQVRITVTDTGKGIPAADIQRVFHPFFTTKGEHGTGLGLYVTRRVIEEHRGEITLQSNERGTTFTIRLPLA